MIHEGKDYAHAFDTYLTLKEITAPSIVPAGYLRFYAKDKSGTSAFYLKDDAGNEREIGPANQVTGTGTANRLAYWSSASVLAANVALTQGQILFPDSNGLPTGESNLFWDATNDRLGIGTNAPVSKLHLAQGGAVNGITVERSDGQANFAGIRITGSATVASQFLAFFGGGGSHTGLLADRAITSLIGIYGAETWGSGAKGSYLTLETTPIGSTTRAERFRIGPSGQWGIGGATYGTAGQYFRSGGASAAPTWATISDADLGSVFALLAGRSGGQTLKGGTASGDDLTLLSTNHATKGNIYFGTLSAYDEINDRWGFGALTPDQQVCVDSDGSTATRGIYVTGFGANTGGAVLTGRKTRGASALAHTTLASGDILGNYVFQGSDGSTYQTGASIRPVTTAAWSGSERGTEIQLRSVATGTTALTTWVKVTGGGALGLADGVTAPATESGWAQLYIDVADGDLKIKFGDGTVKLIMAD